MLRMRKISCHAFDKESLFISLNRHRNPKTVISETLDKNTFLISLAQDAETEAGLRQSVVTPLSFREEESVIREDLCIKVDSAFTPYTPPNSTLCTTLCFKAFN